MTLRELHRELGKILEKEMEQIEDAEIILWHKEGSHWVSLPMTTIEISRDKTEIELIP